MPFHFKLKRLKMILNHGSFHPEPSRDMVFSSPVFLFAFLPLTLILYHLVGERLRNPLLVSASLCFYAWGETLYLGVIFLSMVVTHLVSQVITAQPPKTKKRILCLMVGLLFNLGLLFHFKYTHFFLETLSGLFHLLGWAWSPLELQPRHLPLGVSFFTFQSIAYLVEVHWGRVIPQRHPGSFFLYLSLFPQLIAGPIVRYQEVKDQLQHRPRDWSEMAEGVRTFITGLAKKVLLADPLGVVVDRIYSNGDELMTTPLAWLAAVAFSLQIYFDFSGYSDMAVGLGRMFGFRLPKNFDHPYTARSVGEFWRRWHISLTLWFRDYVFTPLSMSFQSRPVIPSILVVFALTGLWHGASWTFILWGLYHGCFLCLERTSWSKWMRSRRRPWQHLYVVLVVSVGMGIFRCPNLESVGHLLGNLFNPWNLSTSSYQWARVLSAEFLLVFVLGLVFCTPVKAWFHQLKGGKVGPSPMASPLRVLLLLACIMKVASSTHQAFIYFRF